MPANVASITSSRNEEKSHKNYILSTTLINISNMILFGCGLTLFVIGLQYLTTYKHDYSFTSYSTNMMAGFFVAIGIVTLGLSLFALFVLKPFGSPLVAMLLAGWVIVVFFWLFISGVVGLGMSATGQFNTAIRNNIQQTAQQYDEKAITKQQTRMINWLQSRFECCGLDSFTDWRTLVMVGGFQNPNPNLNLNQGYPNQYGNFPPNRVGPSGIEYRYQFAENVPDTCCGQYQPGCGKNINSIDRVLQLNTKGCLRPYVRQFEQDVIFVAAIATVFGIIYLFISIFLIALAALIRVNVRLLVQSSLARDHMETRRLNR